jgi:hypothetical protein
MTGFKVNSRLKDEIVRLHLSGMTFKDIGGQLGLAEGTVKTHWYLARGQASAKIPESPYPRYDTPPVIEGDALILPDAEIHSTMRSLSIGCWTLRMPGR